MASNSNLFKDSSLYRDFEWTTTCPALLKKVRKHVQGLMLQSGSKHQQSVDWSRVEFRNKSIISQSKRARKASAAYAWFKREVADVVKLHLAPRESHNFIPVHSSAEGLQQEGSVEPEGGDKEPSRPSMAASLPAMASSQPSDASVSAAAAVDVASPTPSSAIAFPAFASLKLLRGPRAFPHGLSAKADRPREVFVRGVGVTLLPCPPFLDTSVPAVGSGCTGFLG